MKRKTEVLYLRIDPVLKAYLTIWAKQEHRSLNAQIETILIKAMDRDAAEHDPWYGFL